MNYTIIRDCSTEPVQVCSHFMEIETEEETFELKIKETVYDYRNANFHFDDFEAAEEVAKILGIDTDTLLDEIISIIYKSE